MILEYFDCLVQFCCPVYTLKTVENDWYDIGQGIVNFFVLMWRGIRFDTKMFLLFSKAAHPSPIRCLTAAVPSFIQDNFCQRYTNSKTCLIGFPYGDIKSWWVFIGCHTLSFGNIDKEANFIWVFYHTVEELLQFFWGSGYGSGVIWITEIGYQVTANGIARVAFSFCMQYYCCNNNAEN